jgi:hypothetical protein
MCLDSNALRLSGFFTMGTVRSCMVETLHEIVRLRVPFGLELNVA